MPNYRIPTNAPNYYDGSRLHEGGAIISLPDNVLPSHFWEAMDDDGLEALQVACDLHYWKTVEFSDPKKKPAIPDRFLPKAKAAPRAKKAGKFQDPAAAKPMPETMSEMNKGKGKRTSDQEAI